MNIKWVNAYLIFKEYLHVESAQETLASFIAIVIIIIGSICSLELVLISPKNFSHLEYIFALEYHSNSSFTCLN